MNKTLVIAVAFVILAACKNNEAEVNSGETNIEAKADTMAIDSDTIAASNVIEETDAVEVVTPEASIVEVRPAKAIDVEYTSFGDKIIADNALTKEMMLKKYKNLKAGDTISVKFKSTIKNVCQKKGCWMSMELPDGKESFVRFKDYGFFVPLNAGNQEAIVSGKAFVDEISVADLKHYAKDEGKAQEDIDKITKPKVTYAFQANGVLISK